MLILSLIVGLAQAEELPDYVPLEIPRLDAQLFRPSLDSESMLWTDESGALAPDPRFRVRLASHYANEPFAIDWSDSEGREGRTRIVDDALALDVMPSFSAGRVRLGLRVPVYLLATSEHTESGGGMGDSSVDGRVTLVERDEGFGLAMTGHLRLPTSGVRPPLGTDRDDLTWEVGGVVDRDFGPVRVSLNAGHRGVPRRSIGEVTWDDQLFFRSGVAYLVGDLGGVSLESAGSLTYAMMGPKVGEERHAGFPVEVLAGGWYRISEQFAVRGGLGAGATGGIGAPRYRAVLGVDWSPPAIQVREGPPEGTRVIEVRVGGEVIEVAVPPGQETVDIAIDMDGRPTVVRVPTGEQPAAEARNEAAAADREAQPAGSEIPPAEGVTAEVDAPAEAPETADAAVTATEPAPDVEAAPATDPDLRVEVPSERSVRVGVRQSDDEIEVRVDDDLYVVGETAQPDRVVIDVQRKAPAVAEVAPEPAPDPIEQIETAYDLEVMPDQHTYIPPSGLPADEVQSWLEGHDHVLFAFDSSEIRPAWGGTIDHVAEALVANPELIVVHLEGHADERGPAVYNDWLSEQRAQAVRDALMERGVSADRIEPRGWGEAEPLDDRSQAEAWKVNRRVDIWVAERR